MKPNYVLDITYNAWQLEFSSTFFDLFLYTRGPTRSSETVNVMRTIFSSRVICDGVIIIIKRNEPISCDVTFPFIVNYGV